MVMVVVGGEGDGATVVTRAIILQLRGLPGVLFYKNLPAYSLIYKRFYQTYLGGRSAYTDLPGYPLVYVTARHGFGAKYKSP